LLTERSSIRYYLSERFRLRFEDAGLEEMLLEEDTNLSAHEERGISAALDWTNPMEPTSDAVGSSAPYPEEQEQAGVIRTLDGDIAGDEFAQDALNYQILLNKIDTLLDRLKLDA
jgi:ankyrin repeat/BTB/POZ domain-containing protein 1